MVKAQYGSRRSRGHHHGQKSIPEYLGFVARALDLRVGSNGGGPKYFSLPFTFRHRLNAWWTLGILIQPIFLNLFRCADNSMPSFSFFKISLTCLPKRLPLYLFRFRSGLSSKIMVNNSFWFGSGLTKNNGSVPVRYASRNSECRDKPIKTETLPSAAACWIPHSHSKPRPRFRSQWLYGSPHPFVVSINWRTITEWLHEHVRRSFWAGSTIAFMKKGQEFWGKKYKNNGTPFTGCLTTLRPTLQSLILRFKLAVIQHLALSRLLYFAQRSSSDVP